MSCKVIRRMLITHETVVFGGGEITTGHREWVTRPCDTPIFDDQSECMGCRKGWNHPHNYRANGPVPTEIPKESPWADALRKLKETDK